MDPLPGAAALARGLLVLARSGRTGVLTVQTNGSRARVGVRAGRVVAMRVEPDDGDSLGDAVRRRGAWSEGSGSPPPRAGEPFGRWGARLGLTTGPAVSHALRKQLHRRMARLFGLDPPELRLTPGCADVGIAEPVGSNEEFRSLYGMKNLSPEGECFITEFCQLIKRAKGDVTLV